MKAASCRRPICHCDRLSGQLAPTTAIVELRARLEAALAEENRRRDELRQVQEAMAMAAAQAGPDAQVAPAAQAVQAEQVAQTATSDVVAGMEAAAAAYAGQGLAPEGGQDMRLSLAWERLREAEAAAEAAREAIVRRWEQLAVDAHNASPTPRSEAVAEAAAAHGTQDTHRIHPHFPAAHATPAPRPDTAELKYAIQSIFDRWDVDRSGLLSLDEVRVSHPLAPYTSSIFHVLAAFMPWQLSPPQLSPPGPRTP